MGSLTVVVGGSRAARACAVSERIQTRGRAGVRQVHAADLPFRRDFGDAVPPGARHVSIDRLDQAFPDGQAGGTRLVLTQSGYQLQKWLDLIATREDVEVIAEASADALRRAAPEAFQRRGPWHEVDLIELEGSGESERQDERGPGNLYHAFRTADPNERLAICRRETAAHERDPIMHLALGSAYMEVQDLDASQAAIERAIELGPGWEAAHYELGKLYLRRDDLERASRAFAEAGRLMPTFSAAFSNLGATLGELDRPDEALRAFQQALRHDPNGFTILNNVGVVSRELSRLSDSEAAFRKVIALAPEFVFGHYNLGHTLFLQGRYKASLAAYAEGQRRDPEKNARQACRLAVVRLAAGDAEGSLRDLRRCTANVPDDQKREILSEAQEILWALLTDQPNLAGWKEVADTVKSQLNGLP